MRVRLFHAPTTSEAMSQLRSELGADALILSTRKVAGGVEIVAALEQADAPPPLPARAPEATPAAIGDPLAVHNLPPKLRLALGGAASRPGPLSEALAGAVPFGALELEIGAPPLMVIGPPGAGKTLTIARLATRLVMQGLRPLVITADERRTGAAEQLAAYTRLLELTLIVAGAPELLQRALARRHAGMPVLIDTAGTDPFDASQHAELVALASAAGAEVALVLPAGIDPMEAAELAGAFTSIGADALVATRLDLSRRLGGILAAAAAGPLRLTEAGIGPGAADGLVPLTPALLADRMLLAAEMRR
jgi:flagellar biosynthesis protein FlhF